MGQSVKVFMKARANDKAAFYFKITGHEMTYNPDDGAEITLIGYDAEGQELKIDAEDIDFIIGG